MCKHELEGLQLQWVHQGRTQLTKWDAMSFPHDLQQSNCGLECINFIIASHSNGLFTLQLRYHHSSSAQTLHTQTHTAVFVADRRCWYRRAHKITSNQARTQEMIIIIIIITNNNNKIKMQTLNAKHSMTHNCRWYGRLDVTKISWVLDGTAASSSLSSRRLIVGYTATWTALVSLCEQLRTNTTTTTTKYKAACIIADTGYDHNQQFSRDWG